MSLDLSGLSKWTDENKNELIKEAVLKGRTVDLVSVQGGIKHSATINRIGSTLDAQAGACGWNAAGTTELTQREIAVADIKFNEAICLNDLEDYYVSTQMNPGSYNESIPFEQIFAENKRDAVQSYVESLIWQGDTVGGSGDLALADGFVKILDDNSLVLGATGTFTASTFASGTNAIDTVDAMVADIPADVIDADDLHLFMSYADFRTYAKQLRDANLFHYTGAENQGAEFSMMIPGTNVRAIAVKGLNGLSKMVVGRASDFVVGTDLLGDYENFKIFYSEDNDEVRWLCKFKIGTQIAFLENVAYYVGV